MVALSFPSTEKDFNLLPPYLIGLQASLVELVACARVIVKEPQLPSKALFDLQIYPWLSTYCDLLLADCDAFLADEKLTPFFKRFLFRKQINELMLLVSEFKAELVGIQKKVHVDLQAAYRRHAQRKELSIQGCEFEGIDSLSPAQWNFWHAQDTARGRGIVAQSRRDPNQPLALTAEAEHVTIESAQQSDQALKEDADHSVSRIEQLLGRVFKKIGASFLKEQVAISTVSLVTGLFFGILFGPTVPVIITCIAGLVGLSIAVIRPFLKHLQRRYHYDRDNVELYYQVGEQAYQRLADEYSQQMLHTESLPEQMVLYRFKLSHDIHTQLQTLTLAMQAAVSSVKPVPVRLDNEVHQRQRAKVVKMLVESAGQLEGLFTDYHEQLLSRMEVGFHTAHFLPDAQGLDYCSIAPDFVSQYQLMASHFNKSNKLSYSHWLASLVERTDLFSPTEESYAGRAIFKLNPKMVKLFDTQYKMLGDDANHYASIRAFIVGDSECLPQDLSPEEKVFISLFCDKTFAGEAHKRPWLLQAMLDFRAVLAEHTNEVRLLNTLQQELASEQYDALVSLIASDLNDTVTWQLLNRLWYIQYEVSMAGETIQARPFFPFEQFLFASAIKLQTNTEIALACFPLMSLPIFQLSHEDIQSYAQRKPTEMFWEKYTLWVNMVGHWIEHNITQEEWCVAELALVQTFYQCTKRVGTQPIEDCFRNHAQHPLLASIQVGHTVDIRQLAVNREVVHEGDGTINDNSTTNRHPSTQGKKPELCW